MLKESIDAINSKIKNKNLPLYFFTSNLCMIDEKSKLSSSFSDPKNIPVYYYIAKQFNPKNVIEVSPGLGFYSSAILKGSNSIESIKGYHIENENYYNYRLFLKNIKRSNRKVDVDFEFLNKDNMLIDDKEYDMICLSYPLEKSISFDLINDLWDNMSSGYLIINYTGKNQDNLELKNILSHSINREFLQIESRYGISVTEK